MMTTKQAKAKGERNAAWAKANLDKSTLASWAAEQQLRSEEAAKRGAEADAVAYAAAYMAAVR